MIQGDDYKTSPDGGPAFPKVPDDSRNGSAGMSLRDWFAGQALVEWPGTVELRLGGEEAQMRVIAKICYGFADAMLEERNK